MRVVWNAVLAIAIAGAVIAAVPAFAGWDEDNSTNDGMMSSQPTAAEKGALRDSMLRNQWGTRHTNLYLEQFINSRSRTTIQNLLSYFEAPALTTTIPTMVAAAAAEPTALIQAAAVVVSTRTILERNSLT